MGPEDTTLSRRDAPREMLDGRWEVGAVLPGAMGMVLRLTDPSTGARFAAKTPRIEEGVTDATLRRFETEARTWLSLGHHENVVEAFFYERLVWRGVERPFLFLEWVDGPALDALLRAEGRFAVPAALDVMTGIAWGMSHAHGDGREGSRIVHRDLKPDNVFLTRDRVVKVADFGIARALDRPEEHQGEGFGIGTPFYVAPEQMRDARRADARSDVYSFGAVAYQLLCGEPPFPAADLSSLVWKVLREPPPPLLPRVPRVPESLERLVLDCLAKEPTSRPGSFVEVLERVSAVRELDELWLPPAGARSCDACGWMSLSPEPSCPLCGKRTGRGVRYAPVSRRWDLALPTLGRAGTAARLEIEGVQVRPRKPRAGDEIVVTVLVGNTGGVPAVGVALPYVRPSRDAFAFADRTVRRGFRGTIAPTAPGAPIRISWTLRPLRDGRFRLRAPRLTWRAADGTRQAVRGDDVEIVVAPNAAVPLVGRTEELAELTRLLDGTEDACGAAAILLGRPGTGKSRLVREILDRAARQRFAPIRGRCLDRGVEVRGALKEAVRQLLDLPKSGAAAPEVAASLVQFLGDTAHGEPRVLAFLVDELLGRPLAQAENPGHLWARAGAVLSRARPLALAIEDVQRDPEVGRIALEMASAARRGHGRLLVVLTGRSDDAPEVEELVRQVDELAEQGAPAAVIRLRALGRDQVEALLDEAFRPNDFATTAPWLSDDLRTITGGNPMFLSELLRALRAQTSGERPLLATLGGAWTAGPGLTPERLREILPPRVEQLVEARLKELPAAVREFAHGAAVLGDVFETDLLRRVLGDPPDFEASLAALEDEGLLREVSDGRIRFRESLLPEILHRDLRTTDPAGHARLHAAAAAILGARPGSKDRNALRMARHLVQAGRGANAFPALLDAANRLVRRQAYRRAAAVLDEAKRILDSGLRPRRAARTEYLMLRGQALRHTGDYAGALDAWRTVVAEAGTGRTSGAALGTAYSHLGEVHEALGQFDDALYCYAVGLSIRRDEGQFHEVPQSLVSLAGLHVLRGETERAAAYLDEAAAAAESSGNRGALGRALVLRARLLVQRGETRAARALLRRGLQEARTARDDTGAGDAWVVVGQACYREGRAERALVHFRRALRIRQSTGDPARIAASLATLGTVHEAADDLESAQSAYERAAETFRRIRSRRSLAIAAVNLGRVQLALALPRKARATMEDALVQAKDLGDAAFVAVCHAQLALALRWLGDLAPCEEHLAEARRIAAAASDHDVEAHVATLHAEHLDAAGRRAEASAVIREALRIPRISPQVRADALAVAADLTSGAEAEAAAAEAVALSSQLASRTSRARAMAARGQLDLRSGETARAAVTLRQAAGLLLSAARPTPLLARVLADSAAALAGTDPEAASSARRRAGEVLAELAARGFSSAPGTGLPPVGGSA